MLVLLSNWQHPYQCDNCKDIIYSKYIGQFVWCSCYKNEVDNTGIAVDQTPDYGRVLGYNCGHRLSEKELEENNIKVKTN